VLVVLNTEALLAKRRAAESQLASANAAWYNASVQHQRQLSSPSTSQNAPGGMGMPNMFDQVMTNPMADMMGTRDTDTERYADIEQRRSQMEQARQHTMQIYAEIQQIDANLRDTRTLAPFDGVIVKKLVEVGDTVQPGQPMLEFADTKALQVVADIPARLVHNLKEGDNVLAKLDVSEGEVNVKVATIFPVADTNRHTVRVEFDLPPSTKASAGTYAEIRLNDTHAAINNYPVIPASSIVWRGGLPMVYVIDNNQQTSLRMIRIGETLPTGEITILSGLREKELIVDKPAPGLTSGQTVNPPAQ
jgi:RND family efflux transporter MFP subunit